MTERRPLLSQVVWEIRTPRALPAALAGAGLAVAGVALQALVRNPLADPYVLGGLARGSAGADHRRVLPVSLLTGALFLVLVDLAARTADRPNELPVGIFTTGLGVPFFLWLLRRRARGGGDAA